MYLIKVFVLSLLFVILCGCGDKDSPSQSSNKNKEQLMKSVSEIKNLISGKKLMTTRLLLGGNELVVDSCELDDEIFLNDNGTYVYKSNTRCSEDDSDSQGTWDIVERDGSIFLISNDLIDGESDMEIVSHNENEIKSKFIGEDENGNTAEIFVFWSILNI